MRHRSILVCLAVLMTVAAVGSGPPAASSGGMAVPSTGSIGTTGHFLACRSTTSSSQTTEYYDQQNRLKTWDCGEGRRPHKGVDILGSRTPGESPVFAAAPGEVWTAERGNGLGWRIVLRHGRDVGGNGLYTYTVYGHMGDCEGRSFIDPAIVPGARVSAGQFLGYQGTDSHPSRCAGRSHLHWEVRVSTTDVSNVFLATPASPNFYTGVALTADDPDRVQSVTASGTAPVAAAPPASGVPSGGSGFLPSGLASLIPPDVAAQIGAALGGQGGSGNFGNFGNLSGFSNPGAFTNPEAFSNFVNLTPPPAASARPVSATPRPSPGRPPTVTARPQPNPTPVPAATANPRPTPAGHPSPTSSPSGQSSFSWSEGGTYGSPGPRPPTPPPPPPGYSYGWNWPQ